MIITAPAFSFHAVCVYVMAVEWRGSVIRNIYRRQCKGMDIGGLLSKGLWRTAAKKRDKTLLVSTMGIENRIAQLCYNGQRKLFLRSNSKIIIIPV